MRLLALVDVMALKHVGNGIAADDASGSPNVDDTLKVQIPAFPRVRTSHEVESLCERGQHGGIDGVVEFFEELRLCFLAEVHLLRLHDVEVGLDARAHGHV